MSDTIEFRKDYDLPAEIGAKAGPPNMPTSNLQPDFRSATPPIITLPSSQIAKQVRCRLIGHADVEAVANLLHEGFPRRPTAEWMAALNRLCSYPTPDGFPRYGYMLESEGQAVGVLLLLSTALGTGPRAIVRCNVSSWYVRPAFRLYAPFLVSRATKDRSATYVNVSPATHTWPIIEAQGFRRFCNGAFAAVPMLSLRSEPGRITKVSKSQADDSRLDPCEWRTLRDHANFGCVSLCLQAKDDSFPFVFRRRLFRKIPLPGAHLVYCRQPSDLARFAGALGRFLALHGMPWVLVGADAAVPHLAGRYFESKMPMYFRGDQRPHPADLAYTEAALFGL